MSCTLIPICSHPYLSQEGAGHAVMSAYVEMVFDNSDGRLPVDRDEVRLRRVIGLKKDEYYLDKKSMTKTEVMNLLETAGFSRSNPYYVVQQGKIAEMANMSDAKRLDLLKDIGGTKVYEERRRDSLYVMRECEGKRRGIQDLVEQLDSRLTALDEERAELAAYQTADKERRSIEYTILDKEISGVKEKLASLDSQREAASRNAGAAAEERLNATTKLKATEKELRAALAERSGLEAARQAAAADREAALRRRAKLELDVRELEERVAEGSGAQSSAARGLKAVEAEIAKAEKELAAATRRLQAAEEKEAALAAEVARSQARLHALYAKQGGEGQYATPAERDTALREEISRLEEAAATKRESRQEALGQADRASRGAEAAEAAVAAAETALEANRRDAEAAQRESLALHTQRDELQNKQKALWRKEDELKKEHVRVKEELSQWDRIMEAAAPRDVTRGLNSVKRLVSQHRIEGVHGTLMELFDCPQALNTAVETVAGNSLFHIVVEDDAVATRLTELLIRDKAGRATFMPLNRLRPTDVEFPTQWGNEVVPLIKRLKYAPKFAPALKQVFGKVVVCRSLELATEVAATDGNVNCVTLNGDQVERRGALRGGFVDVRKSRIEAMREYKGLTGRAGDVDKQLREVDAELAEVAQAITSATAELTKLTAKLQHMQSALGPARAELRAQQARREDLAREATAKQKLAADLAVGLAALEADIAARRGILGTPLGGDLTAAERKEVAKLQPELERKNEELAAARTERLEAQAAADAIDALLTTNLRQRAADLRDTAAEGQPRSDAADLAARRAELNAAEREGAAAAQAEQEAEASLESAATRIRELEAAKEHLTELAAADGRTADDHARVMESLNQKRTQLLMKRADLERRVRELGTLPVDAYEAHRSRPAKELHAALQRANNELKKFAHVNQKALDQYVSFAEQRDELARRKAENDAAEVKIRQLISTLDLRKDEAIERTFKQVALNFRQVFAALVPGGRGELVMQKALHPTAPDGEENEDPGLEGAGGGAGGSKPAGEVAVLEKYSGVKVKVSFGAGDVLSMKQLSGGQKTLVALALIFSIQRCDPAPFYLFDEIDAALDPQYRTTVAQMLRQQAHDDRNPAQFIVTTFHPQILQVADNIYGVSHRNRISKVTMVERSDAVEFLLAEERKAAAEAAAQAAAKGREEAAAEGGGEEAAAMEVD